MTEPLKSVDSATQEYCRQQLRRIAWRVQYRAKVQKKREILTCDEPYLKRTNVNTWDDSLISRLFINELLDNLSSYKERYVIEKIYLEGYGEKEVAKKMQISQQAVNKWKKKALCTLRKKLNSKAY